MHINLFINTKKCVCKYSDYILNNDKKLAVKIFYDNINCTQGGCYEKNIKIRHNLQYKSILWNYIFLNFAVHVYDEISSNRRHSQQI